MKITIAAIGIIRSRRRSQEFQRLADEYTVRASRYLDCDQRFFETEFALMKEVDQPGGRMAPHLILLDSTGKALTSGEFAAHIGQCRDRGVQRTVLALGPPNGWSSEARLRANLMFSLGRVTLPHELARAVLAEQVYRALTILSGHPYHSGH